MPSTFTFFPQLPIELQLLVWSHASEAPTYTIKPANSSWSIHRFVTGSPYRNSCHWRSIIITTFTKTMMHPPDVFWRPVIAMAPSGETIRLNEMDSQRTMTVILQKCRLARSAVLERLKKDVERWKDMDGWIGSDGEKRIREETMKILAELIGEIR